MPLSYSGKTGSFATMAVLLALAGCADLPPREPAPPSPCSIHEASWDCQIERYRNISQ